MTDNDDTRKDVRSAGALFVIEQGGQFLIPTLATNPRRAAHNAAQLGYKGPANVWQCRFRKRPGNVNDKVVQHYMRKQA